MIAVDVPVTGSPYVAQTIRQRRQRSPRPRTCNSGGGIMRRHALRTRSTVKLYDNHLSGRHGRRGHAARVDDGAVAIVTDGTGVDATWQIANARRRPDRHHLRRRHAAWSTPTTRPNVFRIAPTNHGIAFRLRRVPDPEGAEDRAAARRQRVRAARAADARTSAFSQNPESVAAEADAAGAADRPLAADPARARARSDRAPRLGPAADDRGRRSSPPAACGWNVPVYAPPTGADPFIRQQLADHPDWVDGLTFAGRAA